MKNFLSLSTILRSVFALSLAIQSTNSFAEIIRKVFVNGATEFSLSQVQPALIEYQFEYQATGAEEAEAIVDFRPHHGKYMHMVVISEDLQHFAHVHPVYDSSTGRFTIALNLPSSDPDNMDVGSVFPEEGLYHVIGEVRSEGHGMLIHRFDLNVGSSRLNRLLKADIKRNGRWTVYSQGTGDRTLPGAPYKVQLAVEQVPGEGGTAVYFKAHVFFKNAESGEYEAIDNLNRWLMMGGHSILLSLTGNSVSEKHFLHLHSRTPPVGAPFNFFWFNRGAMEDGTYRLWIQFKHFDQIIKIPVTFNFSAL